MGYRNYFYLVDKSLVETVKEMSQNSLLSFASDRGAEVEDGHIWIFDPNFLDLKEVFEFGKLYWDDTISQIESTGYPMFQDAEVWESMYDYSPYVVGKEGLLKAIEIYKRKIIHSYEDLLKDGAEYLLPFGCTVKVDDIKSVDKLAEFIQEKLTWWKRLGVIDLDESHEWLSKSWQYEHQIFDLVRLYKSIEWNKYTLIFVGR